jgi:uncharacterized protein
METEMDHGKRCDEAVHATDPVPASESGETHEQVQRPRMRPVAWFKDLLYRNFAEPLVRSRHPPWFDARAVFFGLLVGFGTPLGAHIVTISLLRLVFRFNFLVGIAFTWVCDPFNWVIIYYGFYCLGSILLDRPRTMTFEVYRDLMERIFSKTYFWEGIADFMALSQDLLLRWFVGSITVALSTSIIGYVVTYRIQMARCKRRARKMGMQYEVLLKELEANAAHDKAPQGPKKGD